MTDSIADIPQADFPRPAILDTHDVFVWSEDQPLTGNYRGIGRRLAAIGDLFRRSRYASGLLLAAKAPNIPPTPILTAAALNAMIADRVPVLIVKDGKPKGNRIPSAHLTAMLASELFLQQFRAVDVVTRVPMYVGDFALTVPGYNDGPPDQRVFYTGEVAAVTHSAPAITAFLDAMPFAANADRTNAVAGAVTRTLRNLWPGAKPIVSVTANKSHAGKDTIITFAAGSARVTSVTYQRTDWAFERSIVGLLKKHPDTAVLNVENARLDNHGTYIASGFLERFVMDPEPTLFSTGTGGPVTRRNDIVVAITTNFGLLSTDLMNRSMPIRLDATGNIEDRHSPISNPKLEYLPTKRAEIDAELRGMIEKWKTEGRPLDEKVRYPLINWAKTVGGILMVNGFTDFLANYGVRKTADDPLRMALGVLGSYRPNEWLPPAEWVRAAAHLGLIKAIVPEADRESDKGRERGMGVVLSAHQEETLAADTDDERFTLQLKRKRARFDGNSPATRYLFKVLTRTELPVDDENSVGDQPAAGAR
jgi:hypothetical protein